MNQIGRRIYFDILTGNVLVDTGEASGPSVTRATVEQDFLAFRALAERVPSTVGAVELDYGQYAEDFMQCNGYRIDPDTGELLFSYPDPNVPEMPQSPPDFRKPLSEEIDELKSKLAAANDANLMTMSALADVFEMMLQLQDQVSGGGSE